mgnify:FL=1
MKQYPGYTLVKREDCPEQHGTLTVLTHDVSGAAVLLVENDDDNKPSASDLAPSPPTTPACSTSSSTRCWQAARSTR